ncbi:MAG: DUF2334 domain-containing protein [archaeon]
MKKSIVLSVHDFSPKFNVELKEILSELNLKNYKKRSILLVPNYDSIFPIRESPKTLDLLASEIDCENEICLHGYNHSKEENHREFKDISYQSSVRKITYAKIRLIEFGIDPEGFVPPYWKISPEGEKALKDEGFTFVVKNPEIKDLRNNHTYSSRPVWFWPHNKPIDYAFRCFDIFLSKVWQQQNDLVRIAIHPQDLWKSKPFDFALKLIDKLSQDREFVSYKEFIDIKSP